MNDFSPADYFRRKLDTLNVPKQDSIAQALQNKVAGLREYQQAAAGNRAFSDAQRSLEDVLKDAAITAVKGAIGLPEAAVGLADLVSGGQAGKAVEEAGVRFKDAKDILENEYSTAQQEANRRVDIADGFVETLDQAIQNPSVIANTVVESIPQMLGGAAVARGILRVGAKALAPDLAGPALPGVLARVAGTSTAPLIAGAAGEGVLGAGAAAERIRQQTEDGLITSKQSLAALGSGAGAAVFGLFGAKIAQRLGLPDIDTALASGSLKSPAGFAKALVGSGITEGALEELPQSVQEQMWQNYALDKPLTEGVGDSAAMGLLSGLAMGNATGAAAGLSGLASLKQSQAANTEASQQTRKQAQQAATESGDVTTLADPKSPTYDPSRAIAALSGNSALPTATPESQEANLTQAGEIVATAQTRRDEAQAAYDAVSPEGLKQTQDFVATLTAKLVAETDPAKIADLQETLDMAKEQIASAPKSDPKELAKLKTQLTAADRQFQEASRSLAGFNERMNASTVDVAAQVATINAPVDVADPVAVTARDTAVKKLINLSMAIPEQLDTQVAESLAANLSNGLTDPQRAYLRAFSAARIAENQLKTMSSVSQEIYTGGRGNIGIAEHRQRVSAALATNNQALANKQLAVLQNFSQDHQAKAAASAEALALQEKTGKNAQAIRVGKTWELNTGRLLNKAEATANGAVTIHMNTPATLVPSFQTEATAITAALTEMQAAYAVKFPTVSITQGASNVPVIPQAPASPANQPAVQPTTPAVGSPATVPGSAPAAVAGSVGTAGVETAGVGKPVRLKDGGQVRITSEASPKAFGSLVQSQFGKPISLVATNEQGEEVGRLTYMPNGGPIDSAVREQDQRRGIGSALYDALEAAGGKVPAESDGAIISDAARALRDSRKKKAVVDSGVSDAVVATSAVDAATVSNQSTESSASAAEAASPESVEPTSEIDSESVAEPVEESVAVASGKLGMMATKSPEGTAYNLRNIVADYFTQTTEREGDATSRPLVAMKDFLSQGWEKIMDYVQFDSLTDEQLTTLRTFWSTAEGWADTIQGNLLRKKNKAYWVVDDLMQFFITETADGKLELEENIKTAISYAAFSWVAENATRPAFNTDEEINVILGRDEDTPIEEHEERALRSVGTRQNVVINTLGQRAVQALGLKASKDAPADLMPKLESAMGAHVFKLLMDQKILSRAAVSGAEMSALTGNTSADDAAVHQFLKLARDEEGNLTEQAEGIYQANKGTKNVLDKLFSVESALKEPSLEPIKFNQATTRNTSQAVPKKLAEIMEQENAGASYSRQDMYFLVNGLDEDIALQIAGGITVDPAEAHVANRRRNEAKNDGLLRELRNIKEFFGSLVSQDSEMAMPLYFEHSVWKQQRVGISTNMVNPQTSKIHRHMLYRKSWETKVSRGDAAQMENFWLRVAEGFGVKTDKQSNEKSMEAFLKKAADPVIQAAVVVLQKNLAGDTLSQAEQEALLAGVKAGGENFKTLDSLMAMAIEANSAGKDFTVQLMGEVDGVTNGPMLSHLLMGAADSVKALFGLLNRGGFYEQGNPQSQYNLWRGIEGNFDLYEVTAGHMVESVQRLVASGVKNRKGNLVMKPGEVGLVMSAIYGFTGTLADKDGRVSKAGRNIIKTPLTAMVFGSSVGAAVESMANKFIESVYASIEDTANGKDGAQTAEQLSENINLLLSQGRAPGIGLRLTIEELMETEFNMAQVEGLKRVFKQTVGSAVTSTMETDFEPYIAQRKQFNLAAQTSFEIFNSVYMALREQLVDELVKSGDIAVNPTTGKPLHDLNAAQEGELRKRLSKMAPVMHTLMSKDSGALKAGLYIAKSKKKLAESERVSESGRTSTPYQSEMRFAVPFRDTGERATYVSSFQTVQAAPGVAMAPMSVHSTDSAISHYAAMLGEVLNVHDAHGAGLATFEQTARNLNQATWNAMLNYSPASEMQAALSRTVLGLAEMIKEGNLPSSVMENLVQSLGKIASKEEMELSDLIGNMMSGMKASSFKADDTKLQALAQMQSIDQYALQGGNYTVTDKDRADASALRAGLSSALSEKEMEAIAAIEAAMEGKPSTTEKIETPLEEDPPLAKANPFGEVGTPKRVNADLVAFFKANPVVSAQEAIAKLASMVGEGTGYHTVLLDMLKRAMPKDVKVRIVTPEMVAADVLAMPSTKSFGWIVGNEIYILSEGFVNSGLQTPEVLLHELVHGAVSGIVENPGKAEAVLVGELKSLMEKAAAYAKQNGITEFDSALADVQEFIAYGMTRTTFQRMLSQVTVDSTDGPKSNVLINGFKSFINTLTELLFTRLGLVGVDKKGRVNTALGELLKNVTGLVNQAEKNVAKTSNAPVLSMAMNPIGTVNTYSTLDIHAALNAGSVTPAFDEKLKNILGGIVEKLHGPFGTFKAGLMKNQALTAVDVWSKALATGVAPFASSVLASPLKISEQEAHAMEQVEATMRAALTRNEASTTSAYRELNKLYTEAVSLIKPSDFATQAEYDYLFKVDASATGRSDYLARFAAFGLANQEVNKLLQKSTAGSQAQKKTTIAERLASLWEDILEFFHEKITGTYKGQRADLKLNKLVEQLVDIEAKKRVAIARAATGSNMLAPVEGGARKLVESAVSKVADVAGSSFVRNNKFAAVRLTGSLGRTILEHRMDEFLEEFGKYRAKQFEGRLGIVAGTFNYAISGSKVLEALLRERKSVEGDRKDIITRRSKMALSAFANEGADLVRNKKASESITQVFMRTGMHVLTGQFNLAELENLLDNKPAMDKEIAALEAQLSGFGRFKDDFISQANALAYFKVTGRNKAEVLMMNAHNISRMYGTQYVGRLTEAQSKQAEAVIEKLVALYALGYTNSFAIRQAKNVLKTENARTDGLGNGVDFVLALHKKLEQESRDRLFQGQDALMSHGYTPEIYSPHVDLLTATEADGEALMRRGYVKGAAVEADPSNPDQTKKFLYVLEGGGLMPYLTGIVSYTGRNAKGSKVHSGYMNINTADGLANAALHATIMSDKAQKRPLAKGPRQDMSKARGSFMAPVVNPQGEIVNWRYLMQDSTKDSVLKRESRFNVVLGTLAGSIFDKETTTEVNTKVFTAMKELYEAEGAITPEAYVLVGPKSTDEEARQIWSMLPDATKAEARRIWGKDGMYVRNDSRDIIFGYRKLSIADAVRSTQKRRADNAERVVRGMPVVKADGPLEAFEQAMATMFTVAIEQQLITYARTKGFDKPEEYGQRAAVLVAKGERVWQEIVAETKDLLVIKSVTVMMGNLKSNMSLLFLSGIPIKDIVANHITAWRGATSYQRDSDDLDRLQTLIDTGQTNGKDAEMRRQMARLTDSLNRNPVKELIEAGLMPTIVEDASADVDIYSYKSQLVEQVDELTDRLQPLVKRAGKNIYMARDTKPYQVLRQITQLSDFMARYTQYQYLTTRKENPLSKEDAIQQSSDDFINYDIPMHRGMQYLDDMGIMPFMKYFLRVQKVIGRLSKDNPARVMGAILLGQFVDLMPIVLDSSMIHRAGNNPLHWGAIQFPGALDELATVSAAAALVK